jgi:hypothetical protein
MIDLVKVKGKNVETINGQLAATEREIALLAIGQRLI